MNKEALITKLLNEKVEKNDTIDLNAYALGLDAMYEALLVHGVSNKAEYTQGYKNGWRDCCNDVKEFG